MDANMMKKLQELLESEAFGKEIENVQSAEELQSAFAAHGVDMTVEEVEEVCAAIVAKNEGTLDENALEQVSGGVAFLTAAAVCRFRGGLLCEILPEKENWTFYRFGAGSIVLEQMRQGNSDRIQSKRLSPLSS